MAVITTTLYKCDCCGVESKDDSFNTGSQCGSSKITIKGSEGGLCMGKDWGGASINKEYLVCFECSADIRKFMSELELKAKQGER